MSYLTAESHWSGSATDSRKCPFCSIWLSRVDAARRHARRCPERGGRALLDNKRGRRTKACDQCSHVKVHCKPHKEGPCERCIPRNLICSLDRREADTADITTSLEVPLEVNRAQDGRIPLSFLLNATDDQQDYLTERAIGMEPDGTPLGPTFTSRTNAYDPSDDILGYLDPSILLLFDQEILDTNAASNGYSDAHGNHGLINPVSDKSWEITISCRLDLLEYELLKYAGGGQCGLNAFDRQNFRSFFDAHNVHEFVTAFCRKRHYRYPIIHWPTFDAERVSLALLLVVCLTGAAYSYQEEHDSSVAVEARQFYKLADAYISDQFECYLRSPLDQSKISTSIELCQAALLMYALDTLPAGDMEMQHTAIAKRLPMLISALRQLEFVGVQHEAFEEWGTFIQREQIIRIVAWTFCADCLATLSCNKPPGFSIQEMRGDLPCSPAIWEADEDIFSGLEKQDARTVPSHLVDLMSQWLNNDWPIAIDRLELPVFHLHVMLCAFQQVIFNSHVTMFLPRPTIKLLQALETWRDLWHRTIERLRDDDRKWLGVAKHVSDLEHLSRRIIDVAAGPQAKDFRYLQRIPSFGTREIHEFMKSIVSKVQ